MTGNIVFIAKYIACILLLITIILLPSWVARQNGKDKVKMASVRLGSWLCGWSIIAWLWALFIAAKK
jgi:hypothetical protein